ncbi:Na+/H+ antiporter NhaA [Clostridium oryzae]|uniref:Na(+)/H(+) antiporter NhaA n=1 Tax=Clostridium oryzae TaxID=1450648 RepID=A0A1V4IIP0_9CLOT|nr:Na+/H+ antiporter NhaA [Clostridium oryzae]OPJ59871.1 Na(+)/H(+) antiporter NhaA [Clostridium oryzae]
MKANMNNKKENVFLEFYKSESFSGFILLIFAIIAMVMANSNFSEQYDHILHTYIAIGYKNMSISMSILHWINDGLMAIFFFVVGMEIKRELVIGELKSAKQRILPVSAAAGGMIVPAVIYTLINLGRPTVIGWGIPTATDIAFALGILSIAGRKVPKGIKVFLTALAIADDLGAIIVIAIFYTNKIYWRALLAALIIFAILMLTEKTKVKSVLFFTIAGFFLWLCFLRSGIHSTIAGVMLGISLPTGRNNDEFKSSMLYKFEHILAPWSSFVIMPLFALSNAGVHIDIKSISKMVLDPVSLGIILGLFVGKQLGIFGMSYIMLKFKIAKLSPKVKLQQLYGASILGGIGFTMSMFISTLAFTDNELLSTAKISIMFASLLSAIVGSAIFKLIAIVPKDEHVR